MGLEQFRIKFCFQFCSNQNPVIADVLIKLIQFGFRALAIEQQMLSELNRAAAQSRIGFKFGFLQVSLMICKNS